MFLPSVPAATCVVFLRERDIREDPLHVFWIYCFGGRPTSHLKKAALRRRSPACSTGCRLPTDDETIHVSIWTCFRQRWRIRGAFGSKSNRLSWCILWISSEIEWLSLLPSIRRFRIRISTPVLPNLTELYSVLQ
jgi:hypothetical protein